MQRVTRHATPVLRTAIAALTLWSAADILRPRHSDFRDIDSVALARLDADMWRSYYARRPVRLFWQLAAALRTQFQTGFWRSFPMAYRAARAAFVFKDGRTREDYAKALPDLERYFLSINGLAQAPFDAHAAAQNELEWWIIRREPARFSTLDWERLIAAVAGEIYHHPAQRFAEYARLRVEAMVLRDRMGDGITDEDWRKIQSTLERSWDAFAAAARS
jgi:hypothetical protein